MIETAKYYLENETGERISLTLGDGNVVAKSVNGLGTESDVSIASLQNGFNALVKEYPDLSELVISGIIINDAYADYRYLVDWMLRAERLYFIYNPYDMEYTREVRFGKITKGNRTNDLMKFTLTLGALTPWYRTETLSGASVNVTALGQLPSAVDITIVKTTANKELTIDAGDCGKCVINSTSTMQSGDIIKLSSVPNETHFSINGNNSVQYIDITQHPFIRVPAGDTEVISCTENMSMVIHHYWRTV